MGNALVIKPTQFVDARSGETTLGIIVCDDYFQYYDNTWDSIPDDNIDVLRKLLETDPSSSTEDLDNALYHHLVEEKKTIDIGGTCYDSDDYKPALKEVGIEDKGNTGENRDRETGEED